MAETFANVAVDLSAACDVFDEFEKYANTGSVGLLATVDTLKGTLAGDDGEYAGPAADDLVALAGRVLSPDTLRAVLDPILLELGRSSEILWPGQRVEDAWEEIFDYMHGAPQSINLGADTYDTSATASGTGDGTMYRLTVDEHGYTLAGLDPDTYVAKCVEPKKGGKSHSETFELNGRTARPDNLNLTGSGLTAFRFDGLGARIGLLGNPSFDSATYSGSTISALANWRTQTDGATAVANSNIEIDATNYFRTRPGAATSYGIKFTASETLYQDPVKERSAQIDRDQPYMIAVRWRRNGSTTGTIELRVSDTLGSGGVSASASLDSISDGDWSTLVIAVGADCWPANWATDGFKFQIKVSSLAVGTVTVDDCIFEPWSRFGEGTDSRRGRGAMGQYICYLGGQTPSEKGDSYTFTDTEGARGVISYWLRKANLGYLPAFTATATITASGGRTFTFASSGKTLTASSGSWVTDGFKVGMKLTIAGTSSNNGTFTITVVTATVITVSEAVTDEGPLSATATATGSSTIVDL